MKEQKEELDFFLNIFWHKIMQAVVFWIKATVLTQKKDISSETLNCIVEDIKDTMWPCIRTKETQKLIVKYLEKNFQDDFLLQFSLVMQSDSMKKITQIQNKFLQDLTPDLKNLVDKEVSYEKSL